MSTARIASSTPFSVVTDHNAQPADFDEALADFLLRFVQRNSSTSADPSATELSFQSPEDTKGKGDGFPS